MPNTARRQPALTGLLSSSSLWTLSGLALVACGGGGHTDQPVRIRIYDGPVAGAKWGYDVDGDGILDPNEVQGRPDNSLSGRRPPAMNADWPADWPADWNTDWPADWPGIAEAAGLITQARQVQVTGFRSARGFAHYMVYMARMVFDNFYLLAHPGAGNVEDLARMTDGDVIIAFSSRPYSVETVRLLRAAHQLKIKTIAITDTPSSPLVKYATVPVIVPTEKGKYLFRMGRTFSAIEAILETVFDDPAVEAHERIAYFADRMKAIRGYWEES